MPIGWACTYIALMTWLLLILDSICNDLQRPFCRKIAIALPLRHFCKTISLQTENAAVLFKRYYGTELNKSGNYDKQLFHDMFNTLLRRPRKSEMTKVIPFLPSSPRAFRNGLKRVVGHNN